MFLVVDLFVATTRAMNALRRNEINKRTQISPIGMIETNINRRQDYFIHLDEIRLIRPLPLCTAATSIRAYHLQLKGKQKVAGKGLLKHKQHRFGGTGGYSREFLLGKFCPILQIRTLFQTKKCHFSHSFQTWPLKSIPIFRPEGGYKTQHTRLQRQKLHHHYWD